MKHTTKHICLAALFVAFTAVISQIAIPLPFFGVPLTLQVFAVALCGYLLGPVYGSLSVLLYIILGICGVPVFTNFNTGLSALLGPTGGFIIGFAFFSVLCGIATRLKKVGEILVGMLGLILCHISGTIYYMYLSGTTFVAAVIAVSAPYIIKDAVLCIAAAVISKRIKKVL